MGDFSSEPTSTLVFFVNGKKIIDKEVDPAWTLLYYLRNKLRLCGTKLGCAEGGCGACTVMVSRFNRATSKIIHLAVNACLAPICSMHGSAVTTVEGIGSTKTKLHPVQERIAKAHGSQCGFCTPGIVMSMYTLLRSLPKPTMTDLEVAFQGNLCRCTGYRAIIEGFRGFTEEWEVARANGASNGGNGGCGMGENCCKRKKLDNGNGVRADDEILFDRNEFTPYDPTQEPIFPPELKISSKLDEDYLIIRGKEVSWYRPLTLQQLLLLKSKFPTAKIVVGNTEVGVEVKFKNFVYPVLIQPSSVPELTSIQEVTKGVQVGAAVTLNEMGDYLKSQIANKPEWQTRIFKEIIDMLNWFAGKQIRNVAAIGGNIMTGSPISDMNPILMASNVELLVVNPERERVVIFNEKFFTGYRKNVIEPNEVLIAITIPYTNKNQYFQAYKQAKRRDDDIAIVNCAANVEFDPNSSTIKNINIAYGGMAPTTVIALKTKEKLIGRQWSNEMLECMYTSLEEDLPLHPGAPGGMIQYRRALTLSFVFKVYLVVSDALLKSGINVKPVPERLKSAASGFHARELKSSQYFQVVPKEQPNLDPVGRPIPHLAAYKQASGEAVYCDDMPHFEGELYLCLVTSTRAHANILNIDASAALAVPGVVAFFCHKDIDPDKNHLGAIVHDEELFYSKKVYCQGNVIGAVVAENQMIAQRAAKLVKVDYEDLSPVILTIEEAIDAKSFIVPPKTILKGDPKTAMESAEFVRTGQVRMGGQEHFYLETHCTLAVPKLEDNEIDIYQSTQHVAETQHLVALTLGIPFNRVTVHVKRMGGGFGGKESRATVLGVPVAFAAQRLGRPVRCMLDRDEDMLITGGRHPFLGKYKVGFSSSGKIVAVEMDLFCNAGCSTDLSVAVMDRAIFHFMNSYNIENSRITGTVCKTNLPSNTAFRGFGGPQGMFFMEHVIREVADQLGKQEHEIISANLFNEGDVTHYNQKLEYCTLRRCWDECLSKSKYQERKKEVEKFNQENQYKKRGISILPTMFGIAFTELFLNQSAALVHVYVDGSVLLSHGGAEMGQGLHTKMTQVASRVLGIPPEQIHISESCTDKIPNSTPTAASSGSDLNGMAVMLACQSLAERLKPYKAKNPTGKWSDWVKAAHFDRVSLSATGFYRTPDIGYDAKTNTGVAFNYFTYGVAASEVEIDCLTGDHQVLRTDIVMDLGESLNPAIDIGQIEGAFVQGYGLFTLEELMYSPTGALYTRGPGMYKIPGFTDIPAEFNVSLLRGAPNPRAVYSSKAVGEPPLFLACSAFFAIWEAVKAAREEVGLKGFFRLDAPATASRIRMACQDAIAKRFPEPEAESYKPWNIVP